jgi:hypothetical protein
MVSLNNDDDQKESDLEAIEDNYLLKQDKANDHLDLLQKR